MWLEKRTTDRPSLIAVLDVNGNSVFGWERGEEQRLRLASAYSGSMILKDNLPAALRYENGELRGPSSMLWKMLERSLSGHAGYAHGITITSQRNPNLPLVDSLTVLSMFGDFFDSVTDSTGDLPEMPRLPPGAVG